MADLEPLGRYDIDHLLHPMCGEMNRSYYNIFDKYEGDVTNPNFIAEYKKLQKEYYEKGWILEVTKDKKVTTRVPKNEFRNYLIDLILNENNEEA